MLVLSMIFVRGADYFGVLVCGGNSPPMKGELIMYFRIYFVKKMIKTALIVSLEDRTKLKLDGVLSGRLTRSAHSLREGDVPAIGGSASGGNPAAPACTSEFGTANFGVNLVSPNQVIFPPSFSFILSHNLVTGAHLKRK